LLISRIDIFFQVCKKRKLSMPAEPDEFGSELVTSFTSAVVRVDQQTSTSIPVLA
jgi:hypothetical protein